MMSIDVLIAVNNEIAQQAAREGLVPYVPAQRRRSHLAVLLPQHRLVEAARGWRKTGADVVRGQDRAWGDMGTRPDLERVPAAARRIPPPPSQPRVRRHRGGRVSGRRVGVQAGRGIERRGRHGRRRPTFQTQVLEVQAPGDGPVTSRCIALTAATASHGTSCSRSRMSVLVLTLRRSSSTRRHIAS